MTEAKNELGTIMLTEEQIQSRIRELGAEITRDFQGESVLLICVLKGACMFLSDLMKRIDLDVRVDFMSVSSYGSATKSAGVVKINKDLDESIAGKNVMIVEDIIDSGLTLHYLVENLWRRGPKNIKVCTLLDKPERRQVDMKADYVGFEVEDRFIVGYGLDYDERYRNFPYITYLEE